MAKTEVKEEAKVEKPVAKAEEAPKEPTTKDVLEAFGKYVEGQNQINVQMQQQVEALNGTIKTFNEKLTAPPTPQLPQRSKGAGLLEALLPLAGQLLMPNKPSMADQLVGTILSQQLQTNRIVQLAMVKQFGLNKNEVFGSESVVSGGEHTV